MKYTKSTGRTKINKRPSFQESFELRVHQGGPLDEKGIEVEIPKDSLIEFGKKSKLLIWITMYNEPYSQLLESIAGIYRSYYEL